MSGRPSTGGPARSRYGGYGSGSLRRRGTVTGRRSGSQPCTPRRRRGLLEPCAATSCTHGSEGPRRSNAPGLPGADGIHVNVRLDDQKLCLLVMIGVRADGRKELVALPTVTAESWADLLRDCRRRGMRAPVLAAGDGALGFWSALREVFPETREQRCWFHKISNVLAALPKSAHPGAKKSLAEIWNAEDKSHARDAVKQFEATYGAKFPKAVAKITDDVEQLLAFYDFPAEHWIHLRTTNPIVIWSAVIEKGRDLAVCVVDGVVDAAVAHAESPVSAVRLLPNCDVPVSREAGFDRFRGVGRGRRRVGGVAAGSRRRVRGCGGWRFRDAVAGSRRSLVARRVSGSVGVGSVRVAGGSRP